MNKFYILVIASLALSLNSKRAAVKINCHYNNVRAEKRLHSLANDPEITSFYKLKIYKDTADYSEMIDTKTGMPLGELRGIPTKEFLLRLKNEFFKPSQLKHLRNLNKKLARSSQEK